MRLVKKTEAGKRRVYDIEVAGNHNFYANGVNVHNCGLPIPTIGVATSGGWSIIKSDGAVVNITEAGGAKTVFFTNYGWVGGINNTALVDAGPIPSSTVARVSWVQTRVSLSPAYARDSYTVAQTLGPAYTCTTQNAVGTAKEVCVYKPNPAAQNKSMWANITNAFNSGWQVGDIRGAWLADIVPEVLTASGELVTNGTFATDTSGWTAGNNGTLSVVSGAMQVTNDASGANGGYASQTITTVAGRTYTVSASFTKGTASSGLIKIGTTAGTSGLGSQALGATGSTLLSFIATGTTTYISVQNSVEASATGSWDNISCKLADPDRSVKNTGLIVNGSITKAAVATGAQLVAYSGFSAANYLEQPYNANLDFGTGDFYVMGWGSISDLSGTFRFLERDTATVSSNRILACVVAGSIRGYFGATMIAGQTAITGTMFFLALVRSAGVAYLYVNGVLAGSSASTDNLTLANAVTRLGWSASGGSSSAPTIALWRIGATAPSADQIAHIYNTEKHLFDANAKCVIDGTSAAVTALAYDDNEDALHVGTSWGRSKFRDLVRVESAATSVGAITSISAGQGCHITAGASGGRFYQPALYLREELRRKEEARKALGKVPTFFSFDAVTSQTAFSLPKGWTVKAVYSAGTLKREGSTKDYTVSFDGFAETVNFNAAPGNTVWVSIMAVRRD